MGHATAYGREEELSAPEALLITPGDKRPETIAMLSIQTLMKRFQALPDEALETGGFEDDDEALQAKLDALNR
ncbi:hypothetical protein ACRHM7_12980 [Chromohalobacter israelensis]|uniref:hypothetical protein n=1 Tax=Chromohalobacter israelensis TaxID=141390 RepID=UPI003D7926C6